MEPRELGICAITGTSGYVGSRIMEFFKDQGTSVLELRRVKDIQDSNIVPFSLGEPFDFERLEAAQALVHCAYDFKPIAWAEIYKRNVEGTIDLFKKAKKAGVKRLVFISSISAFDDCKSLYGRAKLEAEKAVLELGGVVIRPGLVYGSGQNTAGGMVGSLTKVIQKSKWIPVIGGSQKMYLCHEKDLAKLVYSFASGLVAPPSKPVIAASPSALSFKEILQTLGIQNGKKPVLVPVPWQMAWMGLKFAESIGLRLKFKSDSLTSLMNPNPNPDFGIQQTLGVQFRNFQSQAQLS